LERRLSY